MSGLSGDTVKSLEHRRRSFFSISISKMPNLSWILLFLAFHCQCNGANSYKILMVFPHPSPSHHFVGRGLMKGLIADGHEVTMISPFSESKIENFTGIHLDGLFDEYMRSKFYSFTEKRNTFCGNFHYIINFSPFPHSDGARQFYSIGHE